VRGNFFIILVELAPITTRWSGVFPSQRFFNVSLYLHLLILGKASLASSGHRGTLDVKQGLIEERVIVRLVSDPTLWQVCTAV
jgi:hypothetical protein